MMRKIVFRLALGAGLVTGLGACSDGLVDPQARQPAGTAARFNYTVTTEYRSYSCYYERGGRIYEDRETWARDTYTYPNSTVSYGEPYLVSYESIDHGPTAGVGYLSCDYYPGYW